MYELLDIYWPSIECQRVEIKDEVTFLALKVFHTAIRWCFDLCTLIPHTHSFFILIFSLLASQPA